MPNSYDVSAEKDYARIPAHMLRTYGASTSCVFKSTSAEFGELSNMASGFPLSLMGHQLNSSEALYQCCRYPDLPEVQETIASAKNAMQSKMFAKPHRQFTRQDWLKVRVAVMRWVIRVKAFQHPKKFGFVLLQTANMPIVEESSRDRFWGAVRQGETLQGANVLGRLLMELREGLRDANNRHEPNPTPPSHLGLVLFGKAL